MDKRLYKSDSNKMIAGVCGGIGEYLKVDPTIIRLIWVLGSIGTVFFPGFLAYLIAMIVIPTKPYR